MIKIFGIILISGAISVFGAYKSSKLKDQDKMVIALYELLCNIKNGIDYGGVPLSTIFNSYESDAFESENFLIQLKSKSDDSFEKAVILLHNKIPEEIFNLYLNLAKKLGKSANRESESILCARTMEQARQLKQKYSEKLAVKQVLFQKLGILCALLCALLLI